MVSLNEFRFLSGNGRDEIITYEWRPETEPIAVLQIHHGVCEHIMRYNGLARFLADHGVFVVGHDCAGHGHSATDVHRFSFGTGGFDILVEDFRTIQERYSNLFPGKPYFIMGHSMGSFVIRSFISRFPGRVTGTLISGTGYMNPTLISGAKMLTKKLASSKGEDYVSNFIHNICMGAYNKGYGAKGGYDWLSTSSQSNQKYADDPWCGGIPTVGLYRDLFTGVYEVCSKDSANTVDKDAAILLLSGAEDIVGDKGVGVAKVADMYKSCGVKNVSTLLFPGMRHEIFMENNKQDVYDMVLKFILSK